MPSVGEVWRTTGPDGRSTVGVIVDYYPAEESVVLLGRTGKTARMPVRSLRMSWKLIHEANLSHICSEHGCQEIAYLHYAGQWRCHRHLRPNEVAAVMGEDRVPAPDEQAAADSEVRYEQPLATCPVCGSSVSGKNRCTSCGCRWKAIHPDVHRDVLVDVVTRLQRLWRSERAQANIIRVAPEHMGAVTDNSARDRREAIIRGSPGGEEPTLCGITVVPGNHPPTILLAEPPQDRSYIHTPTSKLLVRRGQTYYEFATGMPHGRDDVRPWAQVVPQTLSHWRSLRVSGESFQVTGHDIGRDGCLYLLGQDRSDRMLLSKLAEDYVRFDRADAPKTGSIWLLRGATRLTVVVGVQMQGDLPYVTTRLASEDPLLKVTPRTQSVPLTDLWRNYDEQSDGPPVIRAEIGDEWETADGELVYVVHTHPDTGIVRVTVEGETFDTMARAFDEMTKVERMSAFDRLMGDD